MHPRLRDGTSLSVFTFKGSLEKHYLVKNEKGRKFEISYRVFQELKHADGTHPLHIPTELQKRMKKYEILTTNRYVFDGILSRFILIPLGKNIKRFRPICCWINAFLPVAAALLIGFALFLKQRNGYSSTGGLNSLIYCLLIIISLWFHEMAHLVSGISYGYRFTDMGLLLLGIIPVGAYVSHYEKKQARRLERLQLSLAGVEANVLTAAIFLLLSMKASSLDTTFVMTANINILFALLNLLPAFGLDGESALSALLGIESISESSKQFLKSRKFRQRVFQAGAAGYVWTAVLALNFISSAVVGLLLICEVICFGLNIIL